MMNKPNTDHATLEEFVRRLANAAVYNSYDTGEVLARYWKDEAEEWVKWLDQEKP
jgi:hypothetical protein